MLRHGAAAIDQTPRAVIPEHGGMAAHIGMGQDVTKSVAVFGRRLAVRKGGRRNRGTISAKSGRRRIGVPGIAGPSIASETALSATARS